MPIMDKCKHQIPWAECDDCCPAIFQRLDPELFNVSPQTGGSFSYYDLPPNCKTIQDVIEGMDMGYSRGNMFKATYRWGCKGGASDLEYDLRKIIWFAEDQLRRVQEDSSNNKPS